jgi:nucleoside-diphosphate-sugar epimerase
VQDIIDGIVSVFGKEDVCNGEIINLGIDKENTTAEGIEAVEEVLGIKIKMNHIRARPGEQSRSFEYIDKARRLLDYNPQTTLLEGVKAQVEWFKESF